MSARTIIDRHGTLEHYAAVKERLVAGVQPQGTAIVGVDDGWCRNIADRLDQAGKQRRAHLREESAADGIYVERETIVRAAGGARSEIARLGGIGSLRGLHNAQNAACAAACALAMGISRGDAAERPAQLSRPGAPHGAGRPPRQRAVRQRLQGHQCRCRRACAVVLRAIFSGSPAASRSPAASPASTEYFPRIRKAYLIGEAAQEFAGTLGDRVPHEISRDARRRGRQRRARCGSLGLADPVVLLSPACASFDQYRNFEIRGAEFRDLVTALPGVKPVV